VVIKQYDIYIVSLDPTVGAEMQKTRPCVVISPAEMNRVLHTVQIAPLTSNTRAYPWRVPLTFQGKRGIVVLDQIRTVDKRRLSRKAGRVGRKVVERIKRVIREMLVE
jgi:mRNA interferase MazF